MKPINQNLWLKALKEAKRYYKLPASINAYALRYYIDKGGKFKSAAF